MTEAKDRFSDILKDHWERRGQDLKALIDGHTKQSWNKLASAILDRHEVALDGQEHSFVVSLRMRQSQPSVAHLERLAAIAARVGVSAPIGG